VLHRADGGDERPHPAIGPASTASNPGEAVEMDNTRTKPAAEQKVEEPRR